MGSPQTSRKIVRFGTFEADLPGSQLRRNGRKIKLQGQPFQVLALLLGRPGEIVTREELQQALWPADTFVEFDHGLNTAIKKVRQAIGDSADSPRFIETIPRKGYRFIAPVSGSALPSPVPQRRHGLFWVGVAVAFALGAGTAVWVFDRSDTTPAPAPIPLTTDPGDEWSPSFSPDGNKVAYTRHGDFFHGDIFLGPGDIYVELIGASQPLRLTNDPANDHDPAWSPDGRSIAFLRDLTAGRSGVFLIPAIGGTELKVAEIHQPEPQDRAMSWHPSGRWLVLMDKSSANDPFALFLFSLETGETRRLTAPTPKFAADGDPAVSPDGRSVVFARTLEGEGDLYLLKLSEDLSPEGEPERVTFQKQYTGAPAWLPDGKSILFSSGSPHNPSLWRMVARGPGGRPGKPERLAFAGEGAREPAVSRQGRVVYAHLIFEADIWRLELNGGQSRTRGAGPGVKLISSTRLDHTPQYSPDGRRIAFASNRSGSHEIWASNSDGSNAVRLTSFGGPYTADPHWSPDGRWIAFDSRPGGRRDVYVIPSDGGRPKRLTSESESVSWSRDGKWIYTKSNRTGTDQIWKTPWPSDGTGRDAVQLTKEGGGAVPLESPDGTWLYYLKTTEPITTLWRVPVSGGEETKVLDAVYGHNFAVVDQGIYFIPSPRNASVQFLSFATKKIATVATLESYPAYGFSVSPDGRWLLYTQYSGHGSDLMLVENFQ